MRPAVKEIVKLISELLILKEPIYEFGSYQIEGQEELANLRGLFPNKKYIGCDMFPGPGVDQVLNLHRIDLPDETAGTVLCLDTLEHVEYPHTALLECFRILKPDGLCAISSVMNFPIHYYPNDYWRFTPSGFGSLLKPFQTTIILQAGRPDFPHLVFGLGIKGVKPEEVNMFVEKAQKLYG